MANDNKLHAGWMLLRQTVVAWWDDHTFRLAASLAFYTIFSVTPVLLIAVGRRVFFSRDRTRSIGSCASCNNWSARRARRRFAPSCNRRGGLGHGAWAITVGIATFVLGASVAFAELQSALNVIWNVKVEVRRGFLLDYVLDRLRAFSIAASVGFFLLISLVMSAALSALQDYLMS